MHRTFRRPALVAGLATALLLAGSTAALADNVPVADDPGSSPTDGGGVVDGSSFTDLGDGSVVTPDIIPAYNTTTTLPRPQPTALYCTWYGNVAVASGTRYVVWDVNGPYGYWTCNDGSWWFTPI
jgi:hypothetical protein